MNADSSSCGRCAAPAALAAVFAVSARVACAAESPLAGEWGGLDPCGAASLVETPTGARPTIREVGRSPDPIDLKKD